MRKLYVKNWQFFGAKKGELIHTIGPNLYNFNQKYNIKWMNPKMVAILESQKGGNILGNLL
jgi:hypothetical protein